jgi:hypothetical protein
MDVKLMPELMPNFKDLKLSTATVCTRPIDAIRLDLLAVAKSISVTALTLVNGEYTAYSPSVCKEIEKDTRIPKKVVINTKGLSEFDIISVEFKDYKKGIFKKDKVKYMKNQLTLVIFTNKLINVKIFNTGVMEFTGVKELDHCTKIHNYIMGKLGNGIPNFVGILGGEVTQIETYMFKYDFKVGSRIHRTSLRKYLESTELDKKRWHVTSDENISTSSTTFSYPNKDGNLEDLKKKKKNRNTFVVFSTGSVIFFSKNAVEAERAYTAFKELIIGYTKYTNSLVVI